MAKDLKKDDFSKGASGLLAILAIGGLAVLFQAVQNGSLKLHGPTKVADLNTQLSKYEFMARYWVLHALWLFVAIWNVIRWRGANKALNPLSGNDEHIQPAKNVLQNSFEQSILSLLVQISLTTYLTPVQLLKYIPLLNLTWFVGRILFALGYPKYRTFGFMWTALPTLLALVVTLHKFATIQYKLDLPNLPIKL